MLQGVPMVASSPVRHEPPAGLQPNPVEVQSYQAPWKALSEFAMQSELDQAPFQQLVSSFADSSDEDTVVTLEEPIHKHPHHHHHHPQHQPDDGGPPRYPQGPPLNPSPHPAPPPLLLAGPLTERVLQHCPPDQQMSYIQSWPLLFCHSPSDAAGPMVASTGH